MSAVESSAGSDRTSLLGVAGRGIFAGLLAGLIMLLTASVLSASAGLGSAFPMRLVASVRYGPEALVAGQEVILIGWLIHLAVAAVLGVLFIAMAGRPSAVGMLLIYGPAWGAVVWMIMTWLVIPITAPPLYSWSRMIPVWWFVLHLIYGLSLVLLPAAERLFTPRPGGAVATT